MRISVTDLGQIAKMARDAQGLTQQQVADLCRTNRSAIAHLEQGARLPQKEILEVICKHLEIPMYLWSHLDDPDLAVLTSFEHSLSELTGTRVSLDSLETDSSRIAREQVIDLFGNARTDQQALDALNSVLVFYNINLLSKEFFDRYFGVPSLKSADTFDSCVVKYQSEAIRLFSTFSEAYRRLNEPGNLAKHLEPLLPRDIGDLRSREPWNAIERISESDLPDLGYISAGKARKENHERRTLADFLNELANQIEQEASALSKVSEKKKRKMSSLLRQFESRLEHDLMSPLFPPDPDVVRREAEYIAPKDENDLAKIEKTQQQAQRNLSRYLSADHLDVYVATSMRTDADFVSVNRFTESLFDHVDVKGLNLRYFNPTQSWIDDRVAKGLVEALMLKRASLTIYMAQKVDTFGKDSEASVALGQGKPVIVFVPKLKIPSVGIDSAEISAMTRKELENLIATEGGDEDKEDDPLLDTNALIARLLTIRLSKVRNAELPEIARIHWADFDLYSEDQRISDTSLRKEYRNWLDRVIAGSDEEPLEDLHGQIVNILVGASMRFEDRAKIFKEVHPLALQIILSTGILNGILVARSVDSCAELVEALMSNSLHFDLHREDSNYRLVERTTKSTARVISKNSLINNAFVNFYMRTT